MKHARGRRTGAAGLGLLLASGLLSGCGGPSPGGDELGDLMLDLGGNTALPLIWVAPLGLFVGKYEVTNRQFRRFKPAHASGQHKRLSLDGDSQPAVNLTWNEAREFCQWLTTNHSVISMKRYEYRLPTEAEWTLFASGNQPGWEYPWGPDWPPPRDWNYYGRENREPGQKLDHNDGFQVACPVQRSGANSFGLYGVGGNAWEWCEDVEGKASRVFKGASWADCHPYFLRLGRRSSNAPDSRSMTRGFRIVAVPGEVDVESQKRREAE